MPEEQEDKGTRRPRTPDDQGKHSTPSPPLAHSTKQIGKQEDKGTRRAGIQDDQGE